MWSSLTEEYQGPYGDTPPPPFSVTLLQSSTVDIYIFDVNFLQTANPDTDITARHGHGGDEYIKSVTHDKLKFDFLAMQYLKQYTSETKQDINFKYLSGSKKTLSNVYFTDMELSLCIRHLTSSGCMKMGFFQAENSRERASDVSGLT